MTKIEKLKEVPHGAWAALCVVILAVMGIVLWAPHRMWDSLAAADWPHLAGVAGLVGISLAASAGRIVATYRKASRPSLPPLDGDAEDTARLGRRKLGGFAMPHTLLGVVVLTGVIVLCALLAPGCGASPTRVHASIATVSIDTARVGRQLILESMERRIADCAERELAARAACLDSAEATDRALGALFDAALVAIDVYRGEIAASHARGDDPETASAVLARAQSYAAAHWSSFLELGRAAGVNVNVLVGGES